MPAERRRRRCRAQLCPRAARTRLPAVPAAAAAAVQPATAAAARAPRARQWRARRVEAPRCMSLPLQRPQRRRSCARRAAAARATALPVVPAGAAEAAVAAPRRLQGWPEQQRPLQRSTPATAPRAARSAVAAAVRTALGPAPAARRGRRPRRRRARSWGFIVVAVRQEGSTLSPTRTCQPRAASRPPAAVAATSTNRGLDSWSLAWTPPAGRIITTHVRILVNKPLIS